jgi:hypothetical protein
VVDKTFSCNWVPSMLVLYSLTQRVTTHPLSSRSHSRDIRANARIGFSIPRNVPWSPVLSLLRQRIQGPCDVGWEVYARLKAVGWWRPHRVGQELHIGRQSMGRYHCLIVQQCIINLGRSRISRKNGSCTFLKMAQGLVVRIFLQRNLFGYVDALVTYSGRKVSRPRAFCVGTAWLFPPSYIAPSIAAVIRRPKIGSLSNRAGEN